MIADICDNAPMSELAPWEGGDGKKPFHPEAPTQKVPRGAPGRLPEIYKRQTEAFIAPAGNVVPRPPQIPRPLEPRARLALMALAAAVMLGLVWTGIVFMIFSAEAGVLRFVYAAVGLAVAGFAGLVLLLELPRINKYRNNTFIPGVLVYGARSIVEKVVGPVGIGSINLQKIRGSGSGFLSKVFDRSSHNTAPPEIVALHVNRGHGPEMIGVEWDAVHELQRGDIVWFQVESPQQYLFFHKLIPYAPTVAQDEATRKEVFAALHVGANMYIDRAEAKNMGTTKVFHTDVDGNIQVGHAPDAVPKKGADTRQLGLTAQGGFLGGANQYDQSPDVDPNAPPPDDRGIRDFKLTDPTRPFDTFGDIDQGDDDYQQG